LGKPLELDLRGQDRCFFIIEQRKQWNLCQLFRVARHRSSPFMS